jgi:hypothetical protein
MKRRPRLHLVGQDPGDVFNDLAKLRTDLAAPLRRQRIVETFARIPHDKALELYRQKINKAAWLVLIELDRLVLKARGKNPVRFWSPRLRAVGIAKQARTRALRQLEAAGVIRVEQRGKGLSPWVTHLWYPCAD